MSRSLIAVSKPKSVQNFGLKQQVWIDSAVEHSGHVQVVANPNFPNIAETFLDNGSLLATCWPQGLKL